MVVLGRIAAPFGVRGWLRIHPFGDDPEEWLKIPQWRMSPDAEAADERWALRTCEALKPHGNAWVVKLEGVDSRDGSESMRGQFIGALRSELPKPKKGEYYWGDLIGLKVLSMQGEDLGKVINLIETGANPVLVVADGETERLLPFVEAVVRKVDLKAGVVRVDWGADW
jgi:16S rRNA processing protein RimM